MFHKNSFRNTFDVDKLQELKKRGREMSVIEEKLKKLKEKHCNNVNQTLVIRKNKEITDNDLKPNEINNDNVSDLRILPFLEPIIQKFKTMVRIKIR